MWGFAFLHVLYYAFLINFRLVGRVPFYGVNAQEIMKKNLENNMQFTASQWDNISSECKDLLRQMTQTNPANRINSNHILEHKAIQNILHGKIFIQKQNSECAPMTDAGEEIKEIPVKPKRKVSEAEEHSAGTEIAEESISTNFE